jgi:ribosome-binding factor A|tara:strand:- start:1716 stop:2102 length:387 start_codon:yes stop_codon:yes gene_type:complete
VILKRQKTKSSRHLKVIEVIRKAISKILLRNDLPLSPNFQFPLSVINIEMSSDLRISYVYITTHEKIENDEILRRLETCKKYIANKMSLLVELKFTPRIIFRNDTEIESHEIISKLLNSNKVLEDINK